MIGLLFFVVLFAYIFLAKFIINKTYAIYKTKKAKYIALAIMILIPTWDVILGFPIYAYLCVFESGTKIYKTVDKVEGFYVGKKSLSNAPIEPYKGYKFIEYKSMNFSKTTEKYYRSYWADYWDDKRIAGMCVYPHYPNNTEHSYTEAFNKGKCIVKEEIEENEVSRWEFDNDWINKVILYGIDLKLVSSARITDKKNKKIISELVRVIWQGGWIYGIFSSIPVGNSWKIKFPTIHDVPGRTIIIQTLKLKEEK